MNKSSTQRVLGYPAELPPPFRWPTADECKTPIRIFEDLVELLEAIAVEDPTDVVIQASGSMVSALKLCRVVRQQTKAAIRVVAPIIAPQEKLAAETVGVTSLHDLGDGYHEIIELLRSGKASVVPRHLRSGSLEIDSARRKVTVNGNPVKLTKTEFEILFRLACTPCEIVTRRELVSVLWGDCWFGAPNVLGTHLAHLRTKLREAGHENAVVTVRGVGFYFEPQPVQPPSRPTSSRTSRPTSSGTSSGTSSTAPDAASDDGFPTEKGSS